MVNFSDEVNVEIQIYPPTKLSVTLDQVLPYICVQ